MNPGRELDVLVAGKVMGWTEIKKVELNGGTGFQYLGVKPGEVPSKYTGYKPTYSIPPYSTEIASAWEIMEKLKEFEPELSWSDEQHCWCVYLNKKPMDGSWPISEKASHIICLAALKVIGVALE